MRHQRCRIYPLLRSEGKNMSNAVRVDIPGGTVTIDRSSVLVIPNDANNLAGMVRSLLENKRVLSAAKDKVRLRQELDDLIDAYQNLLKNLR